MTVHCINIHLYVFSITAELSFPSQYTIQCKGLYLPAYLVLTLAEQLLFAKVIDAQQFADPHQHSALEGGDGQGHILHWGLPAQHIKISSFW